MLEINQWLCIEDIYFLVQEKALLCFFTKVPKRNVSRLPDVIEDYVAFWGFAGCSWRNMLICSGNLKPPHGATQIFLKHCCKIFTLTYVQQIWEKQREILTEREVVCNLIGLWQFSRRCKKYTAREKWLTIEQMSWYFLCL